MENGVNPKFTTLSHGGDNSTSERPVRSIMRGFMRGEKDRFSNLSSALQGSVDDNQPSRSEKHLSGTSISSLGIAALTIIASEAESEAASPSTSSSALMVDANSAVRQVNKRPRRQKQFPDFVRTELDTSASNLPAANGSNGFNAMSPVGSNVASPAPVLPNTRGNRERTSGSGNVGHANKRKKKRQKPDSNSSGGGGNAGNAGKIKFTLPVEPDEPTYCLCEQVRSHFIL